MVLPMVGRHTYRFLSAPAPVSEVCRCIKNLALKSYHDGK
ncbi:hypothetical protein HMPREF1548_06537 [Clostridium sp. KLE 1755]|nr:hypothetical protein HMPREF1548_06537 [Clostridium sp. KLE 1755]